jgi:uncharacterized damage-inducible protein DinB
MPRLQAPGRGIPLAGSHHSREEVPVTWNRFMCSTLAVLVLSGMFVAPAAQAQGEEVPPPPKPTTYKDDMLFWISDAEGKLLELAEATPEAKYSWSPAKGVRTTAEIFMHVAGANYGIPAAWGVAPPEGFKFDGYEKSLSKKADIQAALKGSFAHMKKALQDADDEALAKQVNLFGFLETTERGAFMLLLSHAHEHLGQSIAYARSNGIVPPWTARQNEALKKAQAEAADKIKGAEAAKKDEHAGHDH